MDVGQQGLFGRRLEDMEDVDPHHDLPVDVATSFAASIGMALYQNDVEMEDRVGYLVFEYLIFINKISIGFDFG